MGKELRRNFAESRKAGKHHRHVRNPSTAPRQEGRWSLQTLLAPLGSSQPFKHVREKLVSKIRKEIKSMCRTQRSPKQEKCLYKTTRAEIGKEPSGTPLERLPMEESNCCFGRKRSPAIKAGALNLCKRFPDGCYRNHRDCTCIGLPVHKNESRILRGNVRLNPLTLAKCLKPSNKGV